MFGRNDDLGINLQERDSRIIYVLHIAVNRFSSSEAAGKNVMLQRAARGYRMAGVNGYQGALWSEELDGKELRGAACNLEPRGSPFSGHRLHGKPFPHHPLQYGMLTLICGSCTTVMHYSSTSYDYLFPTLCVTVFTYIRVRNNLRFKPARRSCEANIILSGRIVSENSRSNYWWRLFGWGRVISFLMLDRSTTTVH